MEGSSSLWHATPLISAASRGSGLYRARHLGAVSRRTAFTQSRACRLAPLLAQCEEGTVELWYRYRCRDLAHGLRECMLMRCAGQRDHCPSLELSWHDSAASAFWAPALGYVLVVCQCLVLTGVDCGKIARSGASPSPGIHVRVGAKALPCTVG